MQDSHVVFIRNKNKNIRFLSSKANINREMAKNIVKIHWQKDVQIEEIDSHCFNSNIDNKFNANYIQWSSDNQFLVVNLMDELLIFETNIHRLFDEKRNLLNDTVGQRLGFRSIRIKPDSEFKYKLTTNEVNSNFCRLPPDIGPRFIDFRFAPPSSFDLNCFQILACLDDHNVLVIYLNLSPIEWRQICNVTRFLNESLMQQSLNDDDDYFDRLNKMRISAFEWHPDITNVDSGNDTLHRYLYFTTKDNNLYSARLIINREIDCEIKILQKIAIKSEIITIKSLKSLLLIQYRDGRIDLYGQNLQKMTTLWSKQDYRIVMNFAHKQLNNDEIEIIFSKYDSIIATIVDVNTMQLQTFKEFSIKQLNDERLMEFHYENIFAVFNLNTYYCLTTMKNDIYSFELGNIDASTLVMRKLIHPSMLKHSDDVHYASISSSSNNALMAILSRQNRFSGKCTNFKVKNVRLYIATTHTINPSSTILSLTKRLFSTNHHHSFNLADLLFMIRYNLLCSDSSENGFNLIVDILLRKVPLWLERWNDDDNNNDLNVWSYQIKCIRYLARYCLIDGEKFLLYGHDKQINRERLEKLIDILNLLIMKSHFKQVFHLIKIDDRFVDELSIEQRISLVNLINANVIDFFPDVIQKQIIQSVENRVQNCPSCNNIVENPSSCYLDQYNTKHNCYGHQFDVDSNSLIILNPVEHSIESCIKCYESKLFVRDDRTSLWPDPQMYPFRFVSKCCLFCI
uniref:Uncharacterized protein LOC113795539 n=1 Tax=Dermatophagoides pteronyssinus TaxID=6956 RepID=A0A6P6YAC1_DERPT|nr:uncharacterized protein LOC113795539 [Dermatophagoides pteronyssinus]